MIMGFDRWPLAPGDARAWAALLTAIRHADESDRYASEQGLQEAFGQPDQDFARGSIAVYHGRTMVGYGVLTSRSVADPVQTARPGTVTCTSPWSARVRPAGSGASPRPCS